MPHDVWGRVQQVSESEPGHRLELRDPSGRLIVVERIASHRGIQHLARGAAVYLFDLERAEARQHSERFHPSNYRELPAPARRRDRAAHCLRVFGAGRDS